MTGSLPHALWPTLLCCGVYEPTPFGGYGADAREQGDGDVVVSCPSCGRDLAIVPASAGPVEPAPPGRYEALVAASRELVEAAKGAADATLSSATDIYELCSESWSQVEAARDAVSRLLASGEGEER